MRICQVVGTLSFSKTHESVAGYRWLLARPLGTKALADGETPDREELVVIDELGARVGDRIGVSEGAEATFPFRPLKMPVDAYAACLIDELTLDRNELDRLLVGESKQ